MSLTPEIDFLDFLDRSQLLLHQENPTLSILGFTLSVNDAPSPEHGMPWVICLHRAPRALVRLFAPLFLGISGLPSESILRPSSLCYTILFEAGTSVFKFRSLAVVIST